MFGLLKFLLFIALLVLALTVPLGKRTFAGHVVAIWKSEEGRDLRDGVSEKVSTLKSSKDEQHTPTAPAHKEPRSRPPMKQAAERAPQRRGTRRGLKRSHRRPRPPRGGRSTMGRKRSRTAPARRRGR